MKLEALVIHNHIEGLKSTFRSHDKVNYSFAYTGPDFDPDLSPYDLLIVPNGSDQIAMMKIKDRVGAFLEEGKALFCFDGWFTDWVPGNRWVMDNSKKTIDIRYYLKEDPYGFFEGVAIDSLIYSNGISGWWACGYIQASPQAQVLLKDTWGRAIVVLDEKSSPGIMVLTASAPVSDKTYATTDDQGSEQDLGRLYQNLLDFIIHQKIHRETSPKI